VSALAAGALAALSGRRPTAAGMLAAGLRRAGPVVAVGLVATLATYLGSLCLLVPGLIVGMMFSLVIPVVMVELLPAGPAVAYHDLRTAKEGGATAQLADVFA
jgi:prepilin signal peptidase PulO-like enzyme (type II secretory pathway)